MTQLATVVKSDKIHVEHDAVTGDYWLSFLTDGKPTGARCKPRPTEILLIEAVQALVNARESTAKAMGLVRKLRGKDDDKAFSYRTVTSPVSDGSISFSTIPIDTSGDSILPEGSALPYYLVDGDKVQEAVLVDERYKLTHKPASLQERLVEAGLISQKHLIERQVEMNQRIVYAGTDLPLETVAEIILLHVLRGVEAVAVGDNLYLCQSTATGVHVSNCVEELHLV